MRFVIALLLALSACTQDHSPSLQKSQKLNAAPPEQSLPRGKVVLSPEGAPEANVRVEIVADDATRERGLMYRQKLADDEGMLFLFPEEKQLSFWMKNTYLPLDMIFIKADMTVLGVVEGATPLTESSREVPGASQYVLEVNAAYARRHNIKAGTKVSFIGAEGVQVQ